MATNGGYVHGLPTESSSQALPFNMQNDKEKSDTVIKEVPLGTPNSEKPKALSVPAMPSYRRSMELSRPKQKQKPLPLDRFHRAWKDQAALVRGMAITLLTGIPFIIFFLVARYALPAHLTIGPKELGATIFELSKWLFCAWGSFWILLWCGRILAAFLSWVCSMSRSLAGFKRLARTLTLRMVLLLWAAVCYNMVGRVFHHALGANIAKDTATVYNWVNELKRAFKFLMIAFAIIFGQGIVLELASVQYVQGWMGPRSQRAFDELETIKKLQHLVDPHVSAETLGIVRKVCRVLFLPIDSNDLYYQISNGGGDNEMWSAYANKIWNSIARGKQALTRFHIDQQLRDMHRDTSHAQDLFTQLDESCDGNVTQDELEKLVQRIGLQLNVRAQAQRGINSLLRKLEAILCIVMVGIILFLYSMYSLLSNSIKDPLIVTSSPILRKRRRPRPRHLLDRSHRPILRLQWRPPRVHQLMRLRLRQAPIRRRRLHRDEGEETHRQQDLPNAHEFRRGWRSRRAGYCGAD